MKKILLLMIPVIAAILAFSGKQITISGKITDDQGNAIAGASILIKNKKIGTSSNATGSYSLSVAENDNRLVVSAAGFQTQEILINKRTTINVILKANSATLQEVVVSGYGQTKRKQITGSVSSVKADYYAANALQGRVPGVSVSSNGLQYSVDDKDFDTEDYSNISENGFHKVTDDPLSTFSIDVDAASYSNVRRFLNQGQLPPAGAVRTEELINYFKYQYPAPKNDQPFSITTEMSTCPWNPQSKLVLIGLQGNEIAAENLPASNLVFLIDVSGSMQQENKLPLVKSSLKMLTDQLREKDKISIVVYAGNAGLVLPPTSGSQKQVIKDAIDALEAGGSTAGGAGIELSYKVAKENLLIKGNNRVILCTDGDFNVGASSDDAMVRLIEKQRESGVYLTVLGYGMGNYKDNKMEQLADKGNGNHAYIDGINEAKKVLVNEFGGTLFTIAKDVKLQIEFNPAKVAGYRLIGYENRLLAKEDFNNDKKDAGELGSGHTVTALYEIIPAGVASPFLKTVDPLKYSTNMEDESSVVTNEILTVKFRYKKPEKNSSELITQVLNDQIFPYAQASANLRFAAAVANFGMLLRNSEFKGKSTFTDVFNMASGAVGTDKEGYRKEFVSLVQTAAKLSDNLAKAE